MLGGVCLLPFCAAAAPFGTKKNSITYSVHHRMVLYIETVPEVCVCDSPRQGDETEARSVKR